MTIAIYIPIAPKSRLVRSVRNHPTTLPHVTAMIEDDWLVSRQALSRHILDNHPILSQANGQQLTAVT